jgi:hypothetical protein
LREVGLIHEALELDRKMSSFALKALDLYHLEEAAFYMISGVCQGACQVLCASVQRRIRIDYSGGRSYCSRDV